MNTVHHNHNGSFHECGRNCGTVDLLFDNNMTVEIFLLNVYSEITVLQLYGIEVLINKVNNL